jgi:molybdate/tungstate transport system permease protein
MNVPKRSILSARGVVLLGVALGLLHLIVFSPFLDPGTNVIFFCTDLFYALVGCVYAATLKRFRWSSYLAGYLILFVLLVVYAQRPLLFVLILFLYAPLFRFPRAMGYAAIFFGSILLLTAYWLPATVILSLLYTVFCALRAQRDRVFSTWMFGVGAVLLALLFLPLAHLLFQTTPQTLIAILTPELRDALWTSVLTSGISTLIVVALGVPLGWFLARVQLRGQVFLDALIDLPIVIPQTAVGIALLAFVGPKTPLGALLASYGIKFSGSHLGIICCQAFVSAPFLIRAAQSAFQEISPKLEYAARSLNASPLRVFWTISLPLASPGILNGCLLAFSRALSEAGSLMIVAYRPATIPVYANDVFIQYGIDEAVPVTALFVIVCLSGFISLKWLYERRRQSLAAP